MKSFKEKLLNYEVTPPSESWQIISTALDEANKTDSQPLKKRNKTLYFILAAAAVTVLIFTVFTTFNNSNKVNKIAASKSIKSIDTDNTKNINNTESKPTVETTNTDADIPADQTSNEPDISPKKYITISGPQGQPVKISSKVASLIVSSDDQYPPNPVWSDKVKKWKDIMLANAVAPTTTNFLDIVALTNTLKVNNP